MDFFRKPTVVRRLFVYGASAVLFVTLMTLGRGYRQNSACIASVLSFEHIEHALLGDSFSKKLDRNSNIELRHAIEANNQPFGGSPVGNKQVTYASIRDIPERDDAGRPNYVPSQLIVYFRGGVSHIRQDEIVEAIGGRIIRTLEMRRGGYLVALPRRLSVADAADELAKLPEIDFVEPNILHYIDAMPNDELYAAYQNRPSELQRWYFNGIGDDHNLNAEAAWNITTGSSNVVIAVIDTGVAIGHPDLAAQIWTNPGEIAGNGVDDDGDGYVDDVHGWDFYNDDNDPTPDLGDGVSGDGNVFHGTFVAGCAAAVSDNQEGVAGASWHSQVMPLKVFTNAGGAPASAIADAIYYAIDHGANVINMSFGSPFPSRIIKRALREALDAGIIPVAAAGNGNTRRPSYPAGFHGVIAVGGSGSGSTYTGSPAAMRGRASFSQFGPSAVDVVAPAVDIVSTAVLSESDELQGYGPAGSYSYFYGSGTSFASPLVAGEAALLLARVHELGLDGCISAKTIERVILTSATKLGDDPTDWPDGGPKWAGHGRVDFLAAVQQIGPQLVTPPHAPLRMSARANDTGGVDLSWIDSSSNEQGFLVERAVKNGKLVGEFEPITEVDRNMTTFTDTTAQYGRTYVYRVAAVNLAGTNYVHKAAKVTLLQQAN
ncbi:MAG TPA: S8 family serine peptidase [Verrucomicrobiae bacterium]|nr:S8 family serine peptidase [Verrucomicrobiae bacterium]